MHQSVDSCRERSAHISDLHSELVDAPPQVILCLHVPLIGYAVVQLPLDLILTLESVILLCPLSFQTLMTQPFSVWMPGSRLMLQAVCQEAWQVCLVFNACVRLDEQCESLELLTPCVLRQGVGGARQAVGKSEGLLFLFKMMTRIANCGQSGDWRIEI